MIKEIADLLWHSGTYYQAIRQSLGILKKKISYNYKNKRLHKKSKDFGCILESNYIHWLKWAESFKDTQQLLFTQLWHSRY